MPVDRSLLPDISPFDVMDRESARLDALLTDLVAAGDAWGAPTRCSEWDARALFSHLRHLEDYNQACLDGTVKELLATMAGHDFNAFNTAGVARYQDAPADELLVEWRSLNIDYRARMRALGDGVVDTSVGDYPSFFQAFYLAVEYATHGDDFLRGDGEYDGRAEWRAAFARFALTEQERPVFLTARDGVTDVQYQDVTYEVPDHDLAEAGAARLGPEGGLPDDVLAALRCFA